MRSSDEANGGMPPSWIADAALIENLPGITDGDHCPLLLTHVGTNDIVIKDRQYTT